LSLNDSYAAFHELNKRPYYDTRRCRLVRTSTTLGAGGHSGSKGFADQGDGALGDTGRGDELGGERTGEVR
jgi:hypothetical protein